MAKVYTMFTHASTLVYVNGLMSNEIHLHISIMQECPLAPYICVLIFHALRYLLETFNMHGKGLGYSDRIL
jgi:hypothetical protein